MEKNQVLEVCQEYDEILAKDGFEIKHRDPTSLEYDMNHIRYMVNEIPKIIDQPCKKEKAMRWLGFVQGVLWFFCSSLSRRYEILLQQRTLMRWERASRAFPDWKAAIPEHFISMRFLLLPEGSSPSVI